MGTQGTVGWRCEQGVGTLTLDRPAAKNALDGAMVHACQDALAEAHQAVQQGQLRALICRATGDFFCAGADLGGMRAVGQQDMASNIQQALQFQGFLAALSDLPVPKWAFVQGGAYGGGVGLLGCMDGVVAVADSRYACPEIHWALAPAVIAPYVVGAIGVRRARYLFMTGARFSASQAHAWGLVHQLVDHPAALDAAEQQWRDHIAAADPTAWMACYQAPEAAPSTAPLTIAQLRAAPAAHARIQDFLAGKR